MMPSLELAEEPVPLWWTTDFILASPEGTPKEEEKWIVGEFNCCSLCIRALMWAQVTGCRGLPSCSLSLAEAPASASVDAWRPTARIASAGLRKV